MDAVPDFWNPRFMLRSPLFRGVEEIWREEDGTDNWPTADAYDRVRQRVGACHSCSGAEIRFVSQGPKTRLFDEHYEVRIYEHGEVQTREQNWHDFFNALTWFMFPRAKAAINARHYEELVEHRDVLYTRGRRSSLEHALSIFHENGIAVVCSDPELSHLMRRFEWKRLFWDHREAVQRHMSFFVLGHALYEKFLTPYVGMTGPSIIFDTTKDFWEQPPSKQRHKVDDWLTRDFTRPCAVAEPRQFSPFPILGYPGLVEDSETAEFYDNTDYFRPGRRPIVKR